MRSIQKKGQGPGLRRHSNPCCCMKFLRGAPDAPFGSSLVGETGVEHVDSGMLRDAAFGKQNRGQNGAFMPDEERGSGLGDRSHGGEFPN